MMNEENTQRRTQLLDYLIAYLLNEDKRYKGCIPPDRFDDKWRLFRSLINVQPPNPVSDDFLSVQNELLQTLTAGKGVTDIANLRSIKDRIYLWQDSEVGT